jgi:RNA polymerase sigma-70 factor, ECF subfamily
LRRTILVVNALIDSSRASSFDEDLVLVERYLAGDETAFESLYSKYYDKVFSIACGVLIDPDEAADAVQEIFTLVYRHLGRFDRRSRFSTWLFRVAVNRSIQEARKHRNKWRLVELDEAIAGAAPEEIDNSDPRVQTVLSRLNPADRALIVLFYWEELSLHEIAESLNCNVNAAKTRLYRARERFRALFEGEDE